MRPSPTNDVFSLGNKYKAQRRKYPIQEVPTNQQKKSSSAIQNLEEKMSRLMEKKLQKHTCNAYICMKDSKNSLIT